jgi:hypothetical protein
LGLGQVTPNKFFEIKSRNIEKWVQSITLKIGEKYKISSCGLPDLQFTLCGIKTNLKVPMVRKKKKKKKKKKQTI